MALTPTTESFEHGKQQKLFQLLDDRGLRLETALVFFTDEFAIEGCPGEGADLAAGETGVVCQVLAVAANTPIGGLSMAIEDDEPQDWLWWRLPQ